MRLLEMINLVLPIEWDSLWKVYVSFSSVHHSQALVRDLEDAGLRVGLGGVVAHDSAHRLAHHRRALVRKRLHRAQVAQQVAFSTTVLAVRVPVGVVAVHGVRWGEDADAARS